MILDLCAVELACNLEKNLAFYSLKQSRAANGVSCPVQAAVPDGTSCICNCPASAAAGKLFWALSQLHKMGAKFGYFRKATQNGFCIPSISPF